MNWLACAFTIWGLGGLAALLLARHKRSANLLGAAAQCAGSVFALVAAMGTLTQETVAAWRWHWPVAIGQCHVELDPLSGWFALVIALLAVITGWYGAGYWHDGEGGRSCGAAWFFSNLLVGGMVLVVVARDAVLFMVAWEIMTLASFFLVTYDDALPQNRRAGWIYLVASHLGAACLLLFFLWRGAQNGSLDFSQWTAEPLDARVVGGWFLLAIVGFGIKAGFMPLHVWLPEAHPAAPSHISALMSGVMIKTGIYGLLRSAAFFSHWPEWWGWLLLGLGLGSGILAALFALAQRDLKRLLAYSSVENIGIIAIAMGLGFLGTHWNLPVLAAAGWGGALLHVLNHALFKGLLFLGAGSVLHATHTRNLEELGGLLKRMPWTGAFFIIASAAISALPPFNGFLSEFIIYTGAIAGISGAMPKAVLAGALVLAGLALIGGLAVACFTRACGVALLGEPRSLPAAQAHESGPTMTAAMGLLATGCLILGLGMPLVWRILVPVVLPLCRFASGAAPAPVVTALQTFSDRLWWISVAAGLLLALAASLAALRRALLRHRGVMTAVTWDCGYARPTARMQYTASSFAQPLTALFHGCLRTRAVETPPQGLFPTRASFSTETPDTSQRRLYQPAFARLSEGLARLRWLQHGNVHLYVLYIALTLLVLLILTLK